MLTVAIENVLKQGGKMEELTFVVTDLDKMSPDVSLDEELIIWDTVENTIKNRLR